MSDKLTAQPGTPEFYRQLLAIAENSEHPMDKALVPVLKKQIEEMEAGEHGRTLLETNGRFD